MRKSFPAKPRYEAQLKAMAVRIKEIKDEKQLTFEAMAKGTGISTTTLNQLINGGIVGSRLTTIMALADFLEVPLVTLLYGEGYTPGVFSRQHKRYTDDAFKNLVVQAYIDDGLPEPVAMEKMNEYFPE